MEPLSREVIVVDVKMRFGSMVVFMVKWAVASIPALLILAVIGVFTVAFLGAMVGR